MRIVVVGIGNVLMGDDGFGVVVVEKLRRLNLPVDIYEFGTLGIQILNFIEGYDLCILIDTVRGGKDPGEIYVFDMDEVDFNLRNPISLHDVGFVEALKLCGFCFNLPRIVVVGVEPERIDFGVGLSKVVKSVIPKVIKIVVGIVDEMMNTPAPEM